jgi:hypothetical protein
MINIDDKMKQVPFGNSAFQIANFIAQQETPERAYRNILLQLDAKRTAMKECEFRRRRREIDIAENEKMMITAIDYEKERCQVNIDEAKFYLDKEIKLIEDCIIEIKVYESLLEKLPAYSREDFENGELEYWKARLLGNAKREILSNNTISSGVLESLEKIGCVIARDEKGQFVLVENNKLKEIEDGYKA